METVINFTDEKDFFEQSLRAGLIGLMKMEFRKTKIEIAENHIPFDFQKCLTVSAQTVQSNISLILQSAALQASAELAKEIENERK